MATHWDHHVPPVQKMASEEVKDWGPLERVKPGFQVASPEAMPLAEAVAGPTGSRQAFHPQVGVLIHDRFPLSQVTERVLNFMKCILIAPGVSVLSSDFLDWCTRHFSLRYQQPPRYIALSAGM